MTVANKKRDSILNSALELFANNDFHSVSMDDIAGAASTAKGTLYYYFKTKEHLYADLISRSAESLSLQPEGQGRISPVETLRLFIEKIIASLAGRRNLARLLFREESGFGLYNGERTDGFCTRPLKDVLAGIVEDGIKRGDFQENLDSPLAALMIFSVIVAAYSLNEKTDPESLKSLITQMILFGITKGGQHDRIKT